MGYPPLDEVNAYMRWKCAIMVIKIGIGLSMMIEIISDDGLMTNVDSDGDYECCGVIT